MSLLLTSLDDILQFIKDIHTHGISWGAVITALLLWSKLKKNMQFKERDERVEGKIDAIMQKVGAEWNSGVQNNSSKDLMNSVRSFYLLLKAIKGRKNKMNQVNLATLLPGLIGAAKLVLQSFGIDIPDEHINATINGIAAVLSIVAIFQSHKKGETNEEYKGDSGPAV